MAAGTSMTTADTFFVFWSLAAPVMRFWKAVEPAPIGKVEAVSATRVGLPTPAVNSGMPAACNGVQEFRVNWFEPTTTAATSSWIIWFAQSALLLGSPPVTQVSSSMGWPPIPLRYWLIHLTAASVTGVSMLLSVAEPLPSVMRPILTGVPLAGVFVPSTLSDDAACAGPASARQCDRQGDQQREQARRASTSVAVHGSPPIGPGTSEDSTQIGTLQRRKPSFPAGRARISERSGRRDQIPPAPSACVKRGFGCRRRSRTWWPCRRRPAWRGGWPRCRSWAPTLSALPLHRTW